MVTLRWIYYNYKTLGDSLQLYLLYYIVGSAILSWAFCFYHGPIQNERALVLIDVLIHFCAIAMIYMGTSMKEISILCILTIVLLKFGGKYFGNDLKSTFSKIK
jgi:hypothetical protein